MIFQEVSQENQIFTIVIKASCKPGGQNRHQKQRNSKHLNLRLWTFSCVMPYFNKHEGLAFWPRYVYFDLNLPTELWTSKEALSHRKKKCLNYRFEVKWKKSCWCIFPRWTDIQYTILIQTLTSTNIFTKELLKPTPIDTFREIRKTPFTYIYAKLYYCTFAKHQQPHIEKII